MRLAKKSRTLLPLALSAVLAACVMAQDHPNVQPNAVRDQLKLSSTGSMPQANSQPAATSPAKSPAPAAAKPPAKTPAPVAPAAPGKTAAKAPAAATAKTAADPKTASKSVSANPAKTPALKTPDEKPVARRDPFDTLLSKARSGNEPPENLPPGKAGLIIETLRINGIVNSPTGMIAVVSNSQQRVYFLRDGDKLYDGSVQKIALDGITFQETGKDAFGKPLERTVTKNLYQISGEKQ
jgi:Tfp pilus assembly protein PilP